MKWLFAALAVLIPIVAIAQIAGTGVTGPTFTKRGTNKATMDLAGISGGGGGGACSNSLDFTQACNSQYIGVLQ